MGGLVKSLFGGSSSSSGNKAWSALGTPLTSMATGGANVFNNLLGELGGGFDQFKKNSGFNYQLNTGQRNVAGTNASRGLLNSGATGKALAGYEANLGNTMYGNWLDRLGTATGLGVSAAGAATGAGSTSKGSSQNGILSTLFG